jgi:hypothetical protein
MKDYLAAVRIESRLYAGQIDGGHKHTPLGIPMRAISLADIEDIIKTRLEDHFPRTPEGAFNLLKLFPRVILNEAGEGHIWEFIHDHGQTFVLDAARKQALRDAGETFTDFDMFRVEQALDLANSTCRTHLDRLPGFQSIADEEMIRTGIKLISAALDNLRSIADTAKSKRYHECLRRTEEAETYLKLVRLGHAMFLDTREISLPAEETEEEEIDPLTSPN